MTRASALAGCALALALTCSAPAHALSPGPRLSVPDAKLTDALECTGPALEGASRDPVLLFPAFSTDRESYGSNYLADLPARGIPTCSITLEDHGFADLQVAAEYAVHAIRTVSARSGRRVAVLGHQHGAINWLQALRYWPDLPRRVSDYISLATPHRGTDAARSYCDSMGGCPPAVWQIATHSGLMDGLSAVPAPPGPSYTSIATEYDVLITPAPDASNMPGARNVVLQDICPGRPVDHFTILTDDLARRLAFDALDNPGPADPARLTEPCTASAGPGGEGGDALGFPLTFAMNFATGAVGAEPDSRCYIAATCPRPRILSLRANARGRIKVVTDTPGRLVLRVTRRRTVRRVVAVRKGATRVRVREGRYRVRATLIDANGTKSAPRRARPKRQREG